MDQSIKAQKESSIKNQEAKVATTELVALYCQILGGASLVEKSPGLSQKVCQEASRRATTD
jgi:hypothetical protein